MKLGGMRAICACICARHGALDLAGVGRGHGITETESLGGVFRGCCWVVEELRHANCLGRLELSLRLKLSLS